MHARCTALLTLSLVWMTHSNIALAAEPATLEAGFAERDITPDVGMEQPGGYGKAYHTKLHDPCKVRAAVFKSGQTRVAIVGIDALGIRRQSVEVVRKAIHDQCGIDERAILIAASHSHSAGPTLGAAPGDYDHDTPLVKRLAFEQSTAINAKYLEHVHAQIVAAVCAADHDKVPARVGVGSDFEDRVSFNRRFRMQGGLSASHPGVGNPAIIEPAGPIDPQVGVVGAWDKDGKLLGTIVNFACHCTTGPGGTSADYVYYLEETVRAAMGGQAIVVFLPGMGGDVTQVDNRAKTGTPQFGEIAARKVGCGVGAAAVRALLAMQPESDLPIVVKTAELKIKRRVPKPERVKRSLEMVEADPEGKGGPDWTFAKEIILLDALLKKEPVATIEVQAIQLGAAVFLTSPAEYFCQYGLDMRKASGFPLTIPVSLANGCVGYVPTEEALGPRGGGYETRLTSYSNLEPTAGSQIRDANLELARQLKPSALPAPPPAPAFTGQGWAYGNLPPELD